MGSLRIVDSLPGVEFIPLKTFSDDRGWLSELFRSDELPEGFSPVMGYVSSTRPGVVRGPHEHVHQTDGFVFLSGKMELILWVREDAGLARMVRVVGESNPCFVTVPPGVVHAYRNVGDNDAMVLNFPNQLYAGWKKAEPVDEIRHELDPHSPFVLP